MPAFIQVATARTAGSQSGCEAGFTLPPTPGNLCLVWVVTNGTMVSVQDSQANDYGPPLRTITSGANTLACYAALITSGESPLTVGAYTTAMRTVSATAKITMVIAEAPALAFDTAGSQIVHQGATSSGTGTAITPGVVTWTGTALDTIAAGFPTASPGTITAPGGYTLEASVTWTAAVLGLAVFSKATDASGTTNPTIGLQTSVAYLGATTTVTHPPCWLSPVSPLGIPIAPPIAAARSSDYGWQPVPVGTPTTITITAIGARWASQPFFSTFNGTVSVTAWDQQAQTATLVVTPATTGVVLLTEASTGQTCKVQSANYWYVAAASHGGNDGNAGTQASPWLTLTKACASSANYDVILLRGGDTTGDTTFPVLLPGYRYVTSYGTGQGTLNGATATAVLRGQAAGYTAHNIRTVCNFYAGGASQVIALVLSDAAIHTEGVVISGCTLSGSSRGIFLGAALSGNATRLYHILIVNNDITNTGAAITISGQTSVNMQALSHVLIDRNFIHDLPGVTGAFTANFGVQTNNTGPEVGPLRVYRNRINRLGYNAVTADAHWGVYCTQSRLRGNVTTGVYSNGSGGSLHNDGTAYDTGQFMSNRIIEYNISYLNEGYGMVDYDGPGYFGCVFRYNLSIDDCTLIHKPDGTPAHGGSIEVASDDPITWIGNTVIRSVYVSSDMCHCINFRQQASQVRFYNNVLISPAGQSCWNINNLVPGYVGNGNYFQSGTGKFRGTIAGTVYTTWASFKAAFTAVVGAQDGSSVAEGSAKFVSPRPMPVWDVDRIAQQAILYRWIAGAPGADLGVNVTSASGFFAGAMDLAGDPLASPPWSIGALAEPSGGLSPFEATVLADTPFSWWRLDEPSGTACHDSMSSQAPGVHTAVTLGAPSCNPASTRKGIAYNGTTAKSALAGGVAMTNAQTSPAFTAECWARPSALAGTTYPMASNTGTSAYWSIGITSAGEVVASISDGTSTIDCTTIALGLTPGRACHLMMTWTVSSTLTIYVDGQTPSQSVTGLSPPVVTLGGMNIGVGPGGTAGRFAGTVQDVAVYARSLVWDRPPIHYAAGVSTPWRYASHASRRRAV